MGIALLLGFWALVLVYVALVSRRTMQMTWLILLVLVALSPLVAWFWPAFR
jgi:hypothetical protein